MNKKLKRLSFCFYILGIFFTSVGITSVFVFNGENLKNKKVYNNNVSKTVSTKELMNSFQNINKKELTPVLYNDFDDAVYNSKYFPTRFIGKLLHYGPDCPECGGKLGCNGQDAKNGNIYYNDSQYGKIRIVAASALLPCGSIIKINTNDQNGMYVIVLDRGVNGNMIDLLEETSKPKAPFQTTSNVVFDIVRYGY